MTHKLSIIAARAADHNASFAAVKRLVSALNSCLNEPRPI